MRAPPDEKVLGLELLTSFVAPEIGPGTMAASLTMSMASLAVSGTVCPRRAHGFRRARAREGCGWLGFMLAKLASKMTISLLSRVRLSPPRVRRRRGASPSESPSSSCRTESPDRAVSRAALVEPPRRGFRRHRFRLFPPASPRLAHKPPFPVIHSAQASPRPPWRLQARSGPWCSGRDCGWQVHRLHPPRHPPRARSHLRLPRRLQTPSGRKVLKLRRKKGRKYLAPAGAVNGWNREKKKSLK